MSAIFYRGKLIFGVKHFELPGQQKDKARMVVQGCIRLTRRGKVMLEKNFKAPGEFWAPNSSMAGLRLVVSVAAIQGVPVHTVDLDSAYLQTYAVQHEVFLMLPPEVIEAMPGDWQAEYFKAVALDKKMGGEGVAVFPIVRNIYGKCDAGTNFIKDFQGSLRRLGWESLPHCMGTFSRVDPVSGRMTVLANYVDDLALAAHTEDNARIWKELAAEWKFSPAEILTKFLGIECRAVGPPGQLYRHYELDQCNYTNNMRAGSLMGSRCHPEKKTRK
jgi:hypothetical protein